MNAETHSAACAILADRSGPWAERRNRLSQIPIPLPGCAEKPPRLKHSTGGQPDSGHRPTASNPAPVFGRRARCGGRPHRLLQTCRASARRCSRPTQETAIGKVHSAAHTGAGSAELSDASLRHASAPGSEATRHGHSGLRPPSAARHSRLLRALPYDDHHFWRSSASSLGPAR